MTWPWLTRAEQRILRQLADDDRPRGVLRLRRDVGLRLWRFDLALASLTRRGYVVGRRHTLYTITMAGRVEAVKRWR